MATQRGGGGKAKDCNGKATSMRTLRTRGMAVLAVLKTEMRGYSKRARPLPTFSSSIKSSEYQHRYLHTNVNIVVIFSYIL